jgi:hypothetical protein
MSDRFIDYITIKEAAENWGVTTRAITYHIISGRIEGAIKKGNLWLLPATTDRPVDFRYKINKRGGDEERKKT